MKKLSNLPKYTNKNLKGSNIYRLKNSNQTIYYDNLTKTAFIISNKDALFFQTWQLRLPLCLMAMGLIILFTSDFKLAVIIGALLFVISSILFRFLFLNKLPVSTTFKKPESHGFIRDIAIKYSNNSLILIAVLFGSMAVSLIANQIIRPIAGAKEIFVYVLMILSIIVTIFLIYVINLKKKEKL